MLKKAGMWYCAVINSNSELWDFASFELTDFFLQAHANLQNRICSHHKCFQHCERWKIKKNSVDLSINIQRWWFVFQMNNSKWEKPLAVIPDGLLVCLWWKIHRWSYSRFLLMQEIIYPCKYCIYLQRYLGISKVIVWGRSTSRMLMTKSLKFAGGGRKATCTKLSCFLSMCKKDDGGLPEWYAYAQNLKLYI